MFGATPSPSFAAVFDFSPGVNFRGVFHIFALREICNPFYEKRERDCLWTGGVPSIGHEVISGKAVQILIGVANEQGVALFFCLYLYAKRASPFMKGDVTMKVFLKDDGTISDVTKKVFADFNVMDSIQFMRKYAVSKDTYLKRVLKYGDPYMNTPLAKIGKFLSCFLR